MLSMKAKYALQALVVLAKNRNKQMQTKAIAAGADIPHKFLEAILTELRNRDIVKSRRGMMGGYTLAHDARDIMVGDIVRIMDGPLAPIRCASLTAYEKCDNCTDEGKCGIRNVMMDARIALSSVLDNRSIADLVKFETEMREGIFDE